MARGKQAATKVTASTAPAEASGEVLDLKAAADFLKVSKPTFYRWLAQGKIKGSKAGTQWRFYRSDLESFMQSAEPSALQVDADSLRQAVDAAREAKGLPRIDWSWPGPLGIGADSEAPEERTLVRVVEMLMTDAIEARASDIHMDVERDRVWVRYRVDGVLSEVMSLPKEAGRPIVSRLKLLADCEVGERRVPQHGRIRISYQGREYDLRTATFPAVFGESIVLRILDQSSVLIGLEKLGFPAATREAFERVLRVPQGLVIVTGPAGSGRTTTLYSALNLLKDPEKKIVTIEDPVEYQLGGVMQMHVNRKAGMPFDIGMRYLVRGDPDIILVGELRDQGTAEACMAAALTGHLVLTAMLPPTAPEVITRLLDMGLEPFMVGASVKAVLAQRLVRRVCPNCTGEYRPNPETLKRLERQAGMDLSHAVFHRGSGCAECRGFGYKRRTALFELMEVDEVMREMIVGRASAAEIRQRAVQAGMITLLRDGIEKATQGVTTIDEVLRVLAEIHAPR
jgi:excisionase family DNA binding protein